MVQLWLQFVPRWIGMYVTNLIGIMTYYIRCGTIFRMSLKVKTLEKFTERFRSMYCYFNFNQLFKWKKVY